MRVDGKDYRTIWYDETTALPTIIDQTRLPYAFETLALKHLDDAAHAIEAMLVRGAPLIGVTAAYGMALAMRDNADDEALEPAYTKLLATRPTAVNLRWALDVMMPLLREAEVAEREPLAFSLAQNIANDDVAMCSAIGDHGLGLLQERWQQVRDKRERLNILTHCNAGWLATVDWGTALAPIYKAQAAGIPLHVWVDETRPRNQGAKLTAWELGQQGIDHTVIVDNVGGHLMQHGEVDLCIVGSDRTTRRGDVCNKIGTYLKALAAHDNNVPFYVALPSSTVDWHLSDGVAEIPIEERDAAEVHEVSDGKSTVRLTPADSRAANYGFDVTPARLVTALITERGVCAADESALSELFPHHS